ncbi:MAG: glycosyltransferase family 4 protein [Bacteroidetes bacterium]|nr:glycosyltransferase family 4 protein [Bacteroidota bacterium]
MQIVVNCRFLLKDKLQGIGWFTFQTLKRIVLKNPSVHFIFLFDRMYSDEFIFGENVTPIIISPQARHPILYIIWFQFSVKKLLNRLKPDLFVSTDGNICLGAKCKQISVIHDINFHHFPSDLPKAESIYHNYFYPKYAQKATRVVTVSEYSKSDISKNYAISTNKIDVVYNGINSFFNPISETDKIKVKEKFASGNNYFVFIGSIHPRKNIVRLIEAFAMFSKTNPHYKLLICGPKFWGEKEIEITIKKNNLANLVVFTGRLSDEDLNLVLASATALTFVPYFEGFGIPLLEAMQCETPIICSNTSSMPEVAGEAALYVNPFEINEIAKAMQEIASNEALRKSLIEKGKLQKQKFSWDNAADLLWQSALKTIN